MSNAPLSAVTLSGLAGTPGYVAPEAGREKYSAKSDVFSLGMLIYLVCTNLLPWRDGFCLDCMCTQQRRPKIPKEIEDGCPALDQLIRDCWQDEVYHRPTCAEVVERLREVRSQSSPSGYQPIATPTVAVDYKRWSCFGPVDPAEPHPCTPNNDDMSTVAESPSPSSMAVLSAAGVSERATSSSSGVVDDIMMSTPGATTDSPTSHSSGWSVQMNFQVPRAFSPMSD